MPAASLVNLIPHLIALAGSSQPPNCPGVLSRHLLVKTKRLLFLFFRIFIFYLEIFVCLCVLAKLAAGARRGSIFSPNHICRGDLAEK